MKKQLPPLEAERRETLIKVASVAITFVVMGALTCLLIGWLVWQMPGADSSIYFSI